MNLFTIGFTKKTAELFFEKLRTAGVKRVVDIRLNNTSQLAGYTKRNDLIYFLKTICNINYVYVPELAPDKKPLDLFKREKGSWAEYRTGYLDLLAARNLDGKFLHEILRDGDCLLCSEATPDSCHRRIVAERAASLDSQVKVIHL